MIRPACLTALLVVSLFLSGCQFRMTDTAENGTLGPTVSLAPGDPGPRILPHGTTRAPSSPAPTTAASSTSAAPATSSSGSGGQGSPAPYPAPYPYPYPYPAPGPTTTVTVTPTPSSTSSPVPSTTETPTPSASPTPSESPPPTTPVPSETPTPTDTPTPTPTETPTPTPSETPTATPTPTDTTPPAATSSTGTSGTNHDVAINAGAFYPAALNVAPGDTVTWTNQDGETHRVVADDGSWDSGDLGPGISYTWTAPMAASWSYSDPGVPGMAGTVNAA